MSDVESNAPVGYTGRVTTVTRVERGVRDDEIRVWSRTLTFRNGLLESAFGETASTVRTRRQLAEGADEPNPEPPSE